jgi:hypothetical protein
MLTQRKFLQYEAIKMLKYLSWYYFWVLISIIGLYLIIIGGGFIISNGNEIIEIGSTGVNLVTFIISPWMIFFSSLTWGEVAINFLSQNGISRQKIWLYNLIHSAIFVSLTLIFDCIMGPVNYFVNAIITPSTWLSIPLHWYGIIFLFYFALSAFAQALISLFNLFNDFKSFIIFAIGLMLTQAIPTYWLRKTPLAIFIRFIVNLFETSNFTMLAIVLATMYLVFQALNYLLLLKMEIREGLFQKY